MFGLHAQDLKPVDYNPGGYGENPCILDANGRIVAGNDEYYVFSGPDDIRLMLAAPDLLNALKALVDACPATFDTRHELAAAKEAIAKAKGEEFFIDDETP
jgi:hypothetical protein